MQIKSLYCTKKVNISAYTEDIVVCGCVGLHGLELLKALQAEHALVGI